MATTKWAAWLDDVMPSLPGAPLNLVEDAIRKAAIAFCADSRFVRVALDEMTTEAGVTAYDVAADTQTEIAGIELVELDGVELSPPARFYELNAADQQINLMADPAGAYPLLVTVSTKPKVSASGVDSQVFLHFREAIASGALMRLMLLPKKPWTSPDLASYHRDEFKSGIRAAQAFVAKLGTTGLMRTTQSSVA